MKDAKTPGAKITVSAGDAYGRLTIISEEKGSRRTFLCQCSCGNVTTVLLERMRSGKTQSCGCYNVDRIKETSTTHGMTKTPVYGVWRGLLDRTTNPNSHKAKSYSERGIGVSEDWLVFENFFRDMGHPPCGMTLDRKNNDGNYCKENCRWATYKEQARNTARVGAKQKGVNRRDLSWRATIGVDGKLIQLGTYKTYEQAVAARLKAERDYWEPAPVVVYLPAQAAPMPARADRN